MMKSRVTLLGLSMFLFASGCGTDVIFSSTADSGQSSDGGSDTGNYSDTDTDTDSDIDTDTDSDADSGTETTDCNATCTGQCESCSLPGKEGTCNPLPADTICRANTGGCDVDELCDGISGVCPDDVPGSFSIPKEGFEADFPPANWEIKNGSSSGMDPGPTWKRGSMDLPPGGSGSNYAVASVGDCILCWMYEGLLTPWLNVSQCTTVTVSFASEFEDGILSGIDDFGSLQARTRRGNSEPGDWETPPLLRLETSNEQTQDIDYTVTSNEEDDEVQFRFYFQAEGTAEFWRIDDVSFSAN